MKLWSDYEGRTIAEAYPLKKLVRPEGRSAFFLTTNGTGTPALVRVIEAHFDESEILTRWKAVQDLGQENLIAMRKFGETTLDGTPLVYAVMEPTEISLAELLLNRTLTAEETRELAHCLVNALKALHKHDMIHGQLEPANILAVGETVKLRSDCVRGAASYPDSDGPTVAELKAQDAHALAVVLLQALTGRTSLQGSATLLPSPFDGIIRNGLSGRWGLTEMAAALGPMAPKQVAENTAKTNGATTPAQTATKSATESGKALAAGEGSSAGGVALKPELIENKPDGRVTAPATEPSAPARPTAPVLVKGATAKPAQESLFAASPEPASSTSPQFVAKSLTGEDRTAASAVAPNVRHRIVQQVEEQKEPNRTRLWAIAAAVVLVLLVLGWRMMRTEPSAKATVAPKPVATLGDADAGKAAAPAASKPSATRYANGKALMPKRVPAPTAPAAPAASAPTAPAASTSAVPVVTGGPGAKTLWRVVAYTYNHQDQAQQKAESLQKQHPSLNAEVFSPTGQAPYLVTVGGPMSREAAAAFKAQARGQGLPHDIYAQNYSR
jgi:hypothetical protein